MVACLLSNVGDQHQGKRSRLVVVESRESCPAEKTRLRTNCKNALAQLPHLLRSEVDRDKLEYNLAMRAAVRASVAALCSHQMTEMPHKIDERKWRRYHGDGCAVVYLKITRELTMSQNVQPVNPRWATQVLSR